MDVARFMPLAEFRQRLTELAAMLKNSRKALDHSTIYIHGEKEQTRKSSQKSKKVVPRLPCFTRKTLPVMH
jgi:LDH2 family malate/lactate/ureidoglycolate dehydrogenase